MIAGLENPTTGTIGWKKRINERNARPNPCT
ncbi:hypothetical protein [Geomicrobium sp. JCM 19055]|nr:hypothetical protein [Geomicrobium sp. JCM 19055]